VAKAAALHVFCAGSGVKAGISVKSRIFAEHCGENLCSDQRQRVIFREITAVCSENQRLSTEKFTGLRRSDSPWNNLKSTRNQAENRYPPVFFRKSPCCQHQHWGFSDTPGGIFETKKRLTAPL
jgi:hypothetical protein